MGNLVLRNLRQRRAQVVSMVVTIAICALVFTTLLLLYGGVSRGVSLNEQRGGADILAVPDDATAWVTDTELLFSGAPVVSYVNESVVDQISQIEGVSRVTVQFFGQTLSESCCSTGEETRIVGFDPATDWVIMPYCNVSVDKLGAGEAIVGCYVDAFKSGTGTILGQEITVVGTLDETGSSLDYSILMDIDAVRDMARNSAGYEHFWDTYGQPDTLVSSVLIDVDESVATADSVERKVNKVEGMAAIQRSSVVSSSAATLNMVFAIMLAAGIALGVASLLQSVARFSSSVWERKAELALYRALGARTRDLRSIICTEAFLITAVGLVVGIVVGIVVYFAACAWMQSVSAFPFSPLPIWQAALGIVAIIVVFLLVTALSIVAPLRQVERIDPASAMAQVDIG